MPNTITIPFFAIKLHLETGGELFMPLNDADALHLNENLDNLAKKYQSAFQQKVMNEGNYQQLMGEYRSGDFLQDKVAVAFPGAKDGVQFPAFVLEFDFVYNPNENGFWGLIPALGIEAYAANYDDLKSQVQEAIQLEFTRKRRLTAVHSIVVAIWFESIELLQQQIELKIHSPAELEKIGEKEKKTLLPEVATQLKPSKQLMFGRTDELAQLQRILRSNFGKNTLLVGSTGVGKTVLVWELARQWNKKNSKKKIWETTASTLIKALTKQTGWQDNVIMLTKELARTGDILFVRNLAELFEVGKYEGNAVSMAEYLRPFIARGEITLITECTDEELAHIEVQSPNYTSFFQIIRLEEPRENLEEIILKKVQAIAEERLVKVDNQAIKEVIRLNRRFTPYAGFPGKPIRFLESIIINHSQKQEKPRRSKRTQKEATEPKVAIAKKEVINYFCEESGMPNFMVDPTIPMDLVEVKSQFNNQVFGQEVAVDSMGDILAAVKTAMTRTGKPIASFLFVGPTGVGKTELAKVLAEFMFGKRDRMIRFDMSEYSNPVSVLRLTGIGSADGTLTSAVRREPFSVLLFDEIEKADGSFYDLLLQILSEGRLTDSQGKLVNFCSAIIIMTSNIGAKNLQSNRIGWKKELNADDVTTHFRSAVEKHFRPELFNRIDQIIPFSPLDEDTIRFVVEREIEFFKKLEGIQFRNLDLQIAEDVLDWLGQKGYDPKYGARQLQRTIREELTTPLSKQLNLFDFDDRLSVKIDLENDTIHIDLEEDVFGGDLLLEQWDKINFADKASELRRKINRLMDGHFYVKLANKLSVLEAKKRREGDDFWKNQRQAAEYAYYSETSQKIANYTKTIEEYEREISLAVMDLGAYRTDFEEKLKEWQLGIFDLKIEIYSRLHPKSNTCQLAIYGSDFASVLDFYLKIAAQKDYQVNGKTLWYRESYYEEMILEGVVAANEEDQQIQSRQRMEYVKADWESELPSEFEAPETGDLLVGIQLEIIGNCAYAFFKNEEGIQQWEMPNETPNLVKIAVSNLPKQAPAQIHRRRYFKNGSPRRFVDAHMVRDPKLRLAHPIPKEGLAEWFYRILEKEFQEMIDGEVV